MDNPGKYMPLPQGLGYRVRSTKYRLFHLSMPALVWRFMPWLARGVYRLWADERFIEYPFAHSVIGSEQGLKILDIGCWGSTFPIELAMLGHTVYGLDVQEYPLQHTNFTFTRGDICRMPFADRYFDVVTAISTVEHIGLGRYDDPVYADGDHRATDEIYRVVKPGGIVIIAVPFGKKGVFSMGGVSLHRVYDAASLRELLMQWQVVEERYYVNRRSYWEEVTVAEAEKLGKLARDVNAIALWVLKKEAQTGNNKKTTNC